MICGSIKYTDGAKRPMRVKNKYGFINQTSSSDVYAFSNDLDLVGIKIPNYEEIEEIYISDRSTPIDYINFWEMERLRRVVFDESVMVRTIQLNTPSLEEVILPYNINDNVYCLNRVNILNLDKVLSKNKFDFGLQMVEGDNN